MQAFTESGSEYILSLAQYYKEVTTEERRSTLALTALTGQMYIDLAGIDSLRARLQAENFHTRPTGTGKERLKYFDREQQYDLTSRLQCRMIGHGAVVALCWQNSLVPTEELEEVIPTAYKALKSIGCQEELYSNKAKLTPVMTQLYLGGLARIQTFGTAENPTDPDREGVIIRQMQLHEIFNKRQSKAAWKSLRDTR